ncbi:hypothetical protein TNCV_1418041 [Trichonephila clavipes]|nr:hypothetical protein TNCV_1418041 [Trichonephila clavipes]
MNSGEKKNSLSGALSLASRINGRRENRRKKKVRLGMEWSSNLDIELAETVVRNDDNCAAGLGFESQRRHGYLLLLLMPPDRQRPDRGPRNASWQRAK